MPRPRCPRRPGYVGGGTGEHDDFTPKWQAVVPCNVPLRMNPSTVPCADWFGSSSSGPWRLGSVTSHKLYVRYMNDLCREDQRKWIHE